MTNETNKTVTISADYFAELFVKAKTNGKLYDDLRKERDELKAKLDEISKHDAIAISDSRLAAAERCIEDIANVDDMPYCVHDIIRAWREKRAAE